MPSDPMKAALKKAAEAVRQHLTNPPCCMEGTGCELPPCHCSSVAAAAAIAAFLDALPVLRGDGPDGAVPISLRPMAAAVRRAAGGE